MTGGPQPFDPPAPAPDDGLASVVLIDPRDDIAAVCGRVDTAPTFAVVVHAPRGNRQLSTELGMRRLVRHAEDGGKVVAIATRSASLANRARQAQVPVARRPERVRWDSGGRRVVRLGKFSLVAPSLGVYGQVLGILLILGLVAGLALTMAPSAEVRISPPAETLSRAVTIIVNEDRSEADLDTFRLPGKELTATRTVTLALKTTGKAPVDTKAGRGVVSVTNPGSEAATVPPGTILLAGAVEFATDASLEVPAGKAASVQVTAVKPGATGNVAGGAINKFKAEAFPSLKPTNPVATSGGAAEERPAAAAADIAAITTQAKDLEKSESIRRLILAERPHDAVVIRTARVTASPGTPSLAAGSSGDVLLLDVELTVRAIGVEAAVLEQLARRVLAEEGAGEFIPGSVAATETGAAQLDGDDGKTFRSEVLLSGSFSRDLQRGAIVDAVKGKSKSDAAAILSERYGVANPEVKLTPGWAPWLPRFGFRIHLKVREAAPGATPAGPTATPTTNDASRTPTPATTPRP